MNPMELQEIAEIFAAALELPAEQRADFLDARCGDNAVLRGELASLLDSYEEDFLEKDVSFRAWELMRGRLMPGDRIGDHYEIVELVGAGGMGEVYLATDLTLERKVALKVLPEYFSRDKRRLKDFENEARTASKLNHANILTVYGFINEGDTNFIVTEFIEGETLRQKLSTTPLDLPTTLRVTGEIASALEAAHDRDIVHRDIKPENIMINDHGQVKILDFGIAKLIDRESSGIETNAPIPGQEGSSGFGTPDYMSPEQLRREAIDHRTDLWSLGVCLYEMLAGKRPFSDNNPIMTIAAILKADPAPLGQEVSTELKDILKTALQKDPNERYQTSGEFQSALGKLFDPRVREAEKLNSKNPHRSNGDMDTLADWMWNAGRKISLAFLVCVLVCLIASGLVAYWSYSSRTGLSQQELADAASKLGLQKKDATEAEIIEHAREIRARSIPSMGSVFHLILIGLAAAHLFRHAGRGRFPPIGNDLENGHLRSDITFSTGYRNKRDWERARRIAERALRSYREAFWGLFVAWFMLYVCMVFLANSQYPLKTPLFTLFNNFNTLCIWFCFRILNEPITTADKGQKSSGITVTEGFRGQIGLLLLVIGIVGCWFAVEADLAYELKGQADVIHKVSKLMSGTFGGVAMGLFIGCFQSKFLKSPNWLIIVLYFYTVIQALFFFFGDSALDSPKWAEVIIFAALLLKTLLILYMFWLFESGRLLFYLVRVRRASTQVDREWQAFREVFEQAKG